MYTIQKYIYYTRTKKKSCRYTYFLKNNKTLSQALRVLTDMNIILYISYTRCTKYAYHISFVHETNNNNNNNNNMPDGYIHIRSCGTLASTEREKNQKNHRKTRTIDVRMSKMFRLIVSIRWGVFRFSRVREKRGKTVGTRILNLNVYFNNIIFFTLTYTQHNNNIHTNDGDDADDGRLEHGHGGRVHLRQFDVWLEGPATAVHVQLLLLRLVLLLLLLLVMVVELLLLLLLVMMMMMVMVVELIYG
ncbi:hypothetical protein AGLY_007436 [Aphis glycines]|uniref:Uncharacterized protein n=1 Tax=Aphis glycines TaxID=307491 RepID=A0A6G0TM02_APHGL|nr:hypothetical protein AGLY_007436 [Aphis glycines]